MLPRPSREPSEPRLLQAGPPPQWWPVVPCSGGTSTSFLLPPGSPLLGWLPGTRHRPHLGRRCAPRRGTLRRTPAQDSRLGRAGGSVKGPGSRNPSAAWPDPHSATRRLCSPWPPSPRAPEEAPQHLSLGLGCRSPCLSPKAASLPSLERRPWDAPFLEPGLHGHRDQALNTRCLADASLYPLHFSNGTARFRRAGDRGKWFFSCVQVFFLCTPCYTEHSAGDTR